MRHLRCSYISILTNLLRTDQCHIHTVLYPEFCKYGVNIATSVEIKSSQHGWGPCQI